MTPDEMKIQVPGFTLALKRWQKENTKPVLCLHGMLDNAASFDFLAPHLSHFSLAAVDSPGVGLSSHYPQGVLPHWKNDAFLLLHLIKALQWQQFDIIAHSLGGLLATEIALALPKQVGKIVFLDILGPKVNFIEKAISNLPHDADIYLNYDEKARRTIYPDLESAARERMKSGIISYESALALTERGTQKLADGWAWTFDQRLRCLSATMPYEDEIKSMMNAMNMPLCLVRAKQGVFYPENIFSERAKQIKNLVIHEVAGGHHVHMDDPAPVADIISTFLSDD